jgi:hypothetical protein
MKFFFLPLCLLTLGSFAQVTDSAVYKAYLKNNMEVLDAGKQLPVKLFDAAFYKNQLFLFGENHGSSMPLAVDPLLFKQLHKKAGVRYYIAEVDDTKAWMLNNFLKDGNEQWLKKVFAGWVADTAQWASQENYNRYKALQAFYTSLPAKDKFTILGIDVVQDYSLLKEHVQFYRNVKSAAAVKVLTDSLAAITDTISFTHRKQLGAYCRRLVQYISTNEKQYRQALGSNFTAFRHTVTSFSFLGAGMYRDSIMYRNFKSLTGTYQLAGKKLFGFMGFYHALQVSYDGRPPFAAHLQQGNTSFSGKTVSIQMFAIGSTVMLPFMGQLKQMMPASYIDQLRQQNPFFPATQKYIPYVLSNDESMMKVAGINNLKSVSTANTVSLFRLNNTGSPYHESRQLMEVTGFQTLKPTSAAAVTTQAFQYVLLYRNSRAALPIE